MESFVTSETSSLHKAAFIAHLKVIDDVIRLVCRRGRVPAHEAADFAASVKCKLIADDYAVFRQNKEKKALGPYVYRVASRHLVDLRNEQWGRFRPTKRAREIGPAAVHLEMLLYRERMGLGAAIALMAHSPRWGMTSRDLQSLHAKLPRRMPVERRPEPLEVVEKRPAPPPVDAAEHLERRNQGRRARQALRLALRRLPTGDRRLLRAYFQEDRSMPAIAAATGQNVFVLYRRLTKILDRLRADLLEQGLTEDVIRELLTDAIYELDTLLENVCVSGLRTLPPRA
jgi:RNA polymerase sigma factor (sigma-70 family)